ncbi:unnamed protein product [Bursaphelenchus okinawaensis]|uniref:N-acetyltransferase domain-containing protein n=1 Tax=Bursaphelenchus okinawaensis TaxID=465554 RepID=A0A811LM73_9BILA|nr:unnamed protein product [Bursaphelenchus okinawaensis]CAG9125995.1 unnamed protein product [Bursaphelenchus okinawaensis]
MQVNPELRLTLKDSPIHVFDRTLFKWVLPRKNPGFEQLINQLGIAASKNKNLRKPITTMTKCVDSNDDSLTVYISWEEKDGAILVHGFVKTARKKLYLRDSKELPYVEHPLCVMDYFFVDNNQDKAIELIDFILEKEQTTIHECAFDEPSQDLKTLLESHYNLSIPVPQAIHFLVYESFFDGLTSVDQSQQQYSSSTTSSRASPTPLSHRSTDQVSDLIHHNVRPEPTVRAAPDTPQGRKFTRDFGHHSIW